MSIGPPRNRGNIPFVDMKGMLLLNLGLCLGVRPLADSRSSFAQTISINLVSGFLNCRQWFEMDWILCNGNFPLHRGPFNTTHGDREGTDETRFTRYSGRLNPESSC